jgi:hypothetical protein
MNRSHGTSFRTALVLGCSIALQACGGLTVTPTAPTTVAERITQGTPTLLRFRGALADGGVFSGYILYGSRDIDLRPEFGRFRARYWEAHVTGGSSTRDAHFSDALGGRALLETYNRPFPTIGLVFLWPTEDPAIQALSPHFHSAPSYDPDRPPGLEDFGELVPGSLTERFGIFRDGQGGETVVSWAQFDPPVEVPGYRPERE